MKGTHIIGLDIISITTGKKIETVTDILYDPKINRVVGILVDEGGWFSESRIIMTNDIVSVGVDAVMVKGEEVVQTSSQVKERVAQIAGGNQNLVKDEVITEGGQKLGTISDIFVTFPGGMVTELEVSGGLLGDLNTGKKTVKISDIITIGEHLIIVKNYTEIKLEAQGQTQGLKGATNLAGEKIQEGYENTKDFTAEKSHQIGQKTQEIASQTEQKTAPIVEEVKEKSQELMAKTGDKIQEIKADIDSGKMEQAFKNTFHNLGVKVGELKQDVSSKASEIGDKTAQKADESKQVITEKSHEVQQNVKNAQIHDAIGKRVINVTILDRMDNVLASPGDLVTHELIEKAKQNNMLDKLLANCE